MFLPDVKTVRGMYRVTDRQHGMTLYVPLDPEGRTRLTVNPSEAFERPSFRSRRVNRATLVMACPVGCWQQDRCKDGMVVQAVHYRAGERDKVARDFYSGRLQVRHKRQQEVLEAAKQGRRRL